MSDTTPPPTVTDNDASLPTQAEGPLEYKAYAGKLSSSTTAEGLRTFFGAAVKGPILSVNLRNGWAHVFLSSKEDLDEAVNTLNRTDLDGATVDIEIARSSHKGEGRAERQYGRNRGKPHGRRGSKVVRDSVPEAEANGGVVLESDAAASAGVEGTSQAPSQKRKKKRYFKRGLKGDAAPTEEESAENASKKPPQANKPRRPRSRRPPHQEPEGDPSKTEVFVAQIGYEIDNEGLAAIFTEANIPVVTAKVIIHERKYFRKIKKSEEGEEGGEGDDASTREANKKVVEIIHKGYGFVDVGSEEQQANAIALLHNKEINKRKIVVKVAIISPRRAKAIAAPTEVTEVIEQVEDTTAEAA